MNIFSRIAKSMEFRLSPYYMALLKWCFYPLPVKQNKIFFRSSAGHGYGDNPKYIAQVLLKDKEEYDLVWMVEDMKEKFPDGIRNVIFESEELSTSRVIVTNMNQ